MMKISVISIAVMLITIQVTGQFPYALAKVPEEMKKGANIITHVEEMDYDVEDINNATLKVHRIFTILSEDGRRHQLFTQYNNKSTSLEDAEIKVYDALGKQIKKYKKKDMATQATGEGLIPDGYVTYCRIEATAYPITVDIEYERKFKTTLSTPDYYIVAGQEAVLKSDYTAHIPESIGFRYKARNTNIKPEIRVDGSKKVYHWSVTNIAPIELEVGSVAAGFLYPQISMVTDKFSYYGISGDFSTWQQFGSWIKDLYTGLDELSPERKQFFANLVRDAPNDGEKIRRIYQYMQENFRYVSIQLGLGGLKPFPADFTDNKKYGDCKGLSNFMKAALKSVGIKSYVAIINSDYNSVPVDPDFPANGFNHVILCVPNQKDSTWLECTSSTAAYGVLGNFTENRNALLITENGGVLVPTPKSKSSSNILRTVTRIGLEDDMSAITETTFSTSGEFEEIMNEILKGKKDDQKMAIVQYFGFRQPDEFVLTRDGDSKLTRLKMALAKVSDFNSGNKFFMAPRINKVWADRLPKTTERKFDFYFRYPFERYDTTIFKLPAGAKPDALAKETELNCPYANYRSKAWYNEKENAVYSATTLILLQYKVLAADYAVVRKFFDDVSQDDTQKMVILKSASTEKKAF